MDALAKLILANPTEAFGIVSALVTLVVWAVTRIPWLAVPEATLRRWATTVVTAVLVGLATEWLAPPFEWQVALKTIFALLGGSLCIYRAVKWIIAQFKPKPKMEATDG